MADSIRAGDVVQLKSGGPLMTVSSVWMNDKGVEMTGCTWFEKSTNISANFPVHALVKEAAGDF